MFDFDQKILLHFPKHYDEGNFFFFFIQTKLLFFNKLIQIKFDYDYN